MMIRSQTVEKPVSWALGFPVTLIQRAVTLTRMERPSPSVTLV